MIEKGGIRFYKETEVGALARCGGENSRNCFLYLVSKLEEAEDIDQNIRIRIVLAPPHYRKNKDHLDTLKKVDWTQVVVTFRFEDFVKDTVSSGTFFGQEVWCLSENKLAEFSLMTNRLHRKPDNMLSLEQIEELYALRKIGPVFESMASSRIQLQMRGLITAYDRAVIEACEKGESKPKTFKVRGQVFHFDDVGYFYEAAEGANSRHIMCLNPRALRTFDKLLDIETDRLNWPEISNNHNDNSSIEQVLNVTKDTAFLVSKYAREAYEKWQYDVIQAERDEKPVPTALKVKVETEYGDIEFVCNGDHAKFCSHDKGDRFALSRRIVTHSIQPQMPLGMLAGFPTLDKDAALKQDNFVAVKDISFEKLAREASKPTRGEFYTAFRNALNQAFEDVILDFNKTLSKDAEIPKKIGDIDYSTSDISFHRKRGAGSIYSISQDLLTKLSQQAILSAGASVNVSSR